MWYNAQMDDSDAIDNRQLVYDMDAQFLTGL